MRVPAMMGGLSAMMFLLDTSPRTACGERSDLLGEAIRMRGYCAIVRSQFLGKSPSPRPSPREEREREFFLHKFGHLSRWQIKLEGIQRHRDHRVITAQSDDLDQPALAQHLHGIVVKAPGNAVAFVQRFTDVVDHPRLRIVESRRAAIADVVDDPR